MNNNILCQREEQTALNGFFEEMLAMIQDSDDSAAKERLKKTLQSMTDNISYIILGEEGTGKTSLLKEIFQDIVDFHEDMVGDICEYLYGEQELATPLSEGYQKKFLTTENMKGISVIDTKGLNILQKYSLDKISQLVETCSAVFVVLNKDNVTSARTWDIIESFPSKKMVFFLTKCDLLSESEIEESMKKIKYYMQDCSINAPVYAVGKDEDVIMKNMSTMKDVRFYIRELLIGKTPFLDKQRENLNETRKLLVQIGESFSLRKKQYASDAEILSKINQAMDGYMANHKSTMENLVNKVTDEINKDIDAYQQEIISKLDPYKIKERFRQKEDFMDYLNMVNENYKSMMTDSVNRKTIEVMKGCLHDLEIIFQEAVGYFNTRENILALNDKFYGSLATSRKQMVAETKEAVVAATGFYQTLSTASETLFMQIWEERRKYDQRIATRKVASIGGGGAVGGALGFFAASHMAATVAATATTTAAAGVAAGSIGMICLVGIGVIVGAVAINYLAKTLYDPKAGEKMEKATQKCIEQFKAEVSNTRTEMIAQISEQIRTIFQEELMSVDGCFTDFRMSVNIDEKKIPLLEQNLLKTQNLLKQIEMMS